MKFGYSPNGELFNMSNILSLRRPAPPGNCRCSPELRKQISRSHGNQGQADDEGDPKGLFAAHFAAESTFIDIGFTNLGHSYLHAFPRSCGFRFKRQCEGTAMVPRSANATAKPKLGAEA